MNPTELLDLIKSRRSVFPPQYNQEEITKEELNQIFEESSANIRYKNET